MRQGVYCDVKIRHDDIKYVMTSKIRHDVKSWSHDAKNTS